MSDFENFDGLRRAIRSAARHLKPPPDLKPSEWAEQNIRIPIGNAVPGLIRFDNAPYQKEPLDMTADPSCQRITLMWGAQVGKTMLALCAQAYKIGQDPQSQIMMQPSQGDLATWLETKFNPLVDSNDDLQDIIAKPRAREGVNNQRMKSYPGGFLMFSWSGSPKTMRGRSAPFIVCDETDGYDKTSEGHPVSLLWQRAATFGDRRKLLEISTPTVKGVSWIESAYEQGDERRFYVPCGSCGGHQYLKWGNVLWDEGEPSTAKYACEHCGVMWNDGERIAAIRKGEWMTDKPFTGHVSYHLNELYSCFRKLGDIAQSFIEKKRAGDLQTFVNVSLAETWEDEGERIDDHDLADRREDFSGKVPEEVMLITAGVDVQDNRLEISVIGWGRDDESWVISHKTLYGDPSTPQLWASLDAELGIVYPSSDGRDIPIWAVCVDSGGHFTNTVYQYCKKNASKKVFAIKGMGGEGKAIAGRPSKSNVGKCPLFPIGVDTVKDLIFARLRIQDPGAGYVHFSDTLDDDYFRQLTAEKIVTRFQRGFKKRVFEKIRPRNEALDCMVYAIAAYAIIGVNVNAYADRMEKQPATMDKPKANANAQRVPFVKQNTGGFANSWR